MWAVVGSILCLLMFVGGVAHAQSDGARCNNVRINAKGTAGAAVSVTNTAGGILVVDENTSRCRLTFINETANPYRCAQSTGHPDYLLVPSATVGMWMPAVFTFPQSGQQAWRCFASTTATISVVEELP